MYPKLGKLFTLIVKITLGKLVSLS